MTTATVTRVIEVDVKASAAAQAHIAQIAESMKGVEKAAKDAKDTSQSFLGGLAGAAKAFAGFFVTDKITEFAMGLNELNEQAKTLSMRLNQVTKNTGDSKAAFQDIVRISIATGRELDTVAKLYEKVQRASSNLGITQAGVALLTQGFADSLKLSGAGTNEANAAMLQFSQSLASGRIQGDEFRSLMENNSVFMAKLGEAAGKTQGQLREMSKAGTIDMAFLQKALFTVGEDGRNLLQRFTDDAAKLPQTFKQAVTGIKAAFVDLLEALQGTAEKSEGFFTKMIKNLTASMRHGARLIRDESQIEESIAEAMGKKQPVKKTEGDLMSERSLNLLDRVGKAEKAMTEAQKAMDQADAAQVNNPNWSKSSRAQLLIDNYNRAKGTLEGVKKLLSEIAQQDSKDTMQPFIAGPPTETAAKKHGIKDNDHSDKDPLSKYNDNLWKEMRKVTDANEGERGEWQSKLDQAWEDTKLDKNKAWVQKWYKTLEEQAIILQAQTRERIMQKALPGLVQAADERWLKQDEAAVKKAKGEKHAWDKKADHEDPVFLLDEQLKELETWFMENADRLKLTQEWFNSTQQGLRQKWAESMMGPIKEVESTATTMGKNFDETFYRMTDSLLQFNKTGKELIRDFVTDFLTQWAKLSIRETMAPFMTQATKQGGWISQAVSGAGNWLTNLFSGSADGSAWGAGGVRFMAQGGILNEATYMGRAADGKHQVAGEAGAEAVLPLRRGANGELGVGQTPVSVTVINNAPGSKATAQESVDPNGNKRVTVMVEELVEQAIGSGRMDKVLGQNFGVSRTGRR